MAGDKKGASRRRATLIFVDESGLSLIPFLAKTWAPRGHTPLVRHRFAWPKLSAISGVTTRGKLYFRVHPGAIKSTQVVAFLRHLLRHTRRPLVVLWDGVGPHVSAHTRRFIEGQPRLQVHRIPPYCPDLNPDVWFWANLKTRQLPNHGAANLAQLRRLIRLAVMRMRRRPKLIASFYRACALSKSTCQRRRQ